MKASCDMDVARPGAPRPLPFYGCLTWVIGLVPKARQAGGLQETDIPNLSDSLRSEEALAAAASGWNDQVLRRKRPSLLRVLLSMNCFSVSVNVVVGVIMSLIQCLARPLAVRLMVRAVMNKKGPADAVPELVCVGIVIFLEGLVWMIVRHAANDIGGTRTMAAMSGLVVTKATRLLDSSKKTSDEKVLVAVDAIGKVNSAFSILSFFVSNALGVFLGSGFALYIIGPATFAGIAVGIIGMLVTHTSGTAAGRYDKLAIENGEQRMRTLNEILANIKGVKIHAWEDQFLERMESFRANETQAYKLWHKTRSLGVNMGRSLPVLCSCATFCTFAVSGGDLTSEVVFPVLAVFQGMRMPFVLLPLNLVFLKTFTISLRRIEIFLLASEAPTVSPLCEGDVLARFDSAKLGFGSDASFAAVLSDLCCDFKAGQIAGVVGPVASGKSTLLLGLLGEFPLEAGTASSTASVGFAPQKPMVISGTLAENIYVGRKPDAKHLAKVLRMCCLEEDLPSLVDGIETEIGERGVTLSGGQQQRLAIARAMYGSPKLLVLDDPLSAVDVRTGAALMSSLAAYAHSGEGCGVVMVVNQPHCLSQCDKLVILGDGGVLAIGPPAEVFTGGCPKGASQRSADFFSSMAVAALAPKQAVDPCDGLDVPEQRGPELTGQEGAQKDGRKDVQKKGPAELKKSTSQLVKADVRQSGDIKRNVYWDLINSIGVTRLLAVLLMFFVAHGFYAANDLWLIHWTQGGADTTVGVVVLTGLTLAYAIGASVAALVWYSAAAAAGRRIFRDCMLAVLRAPLGWFDETPSGRITSRFSGDLNAIDTAFAQFTEAFAQFVFLAVAVLITSMYLNPYFAFIAAAYVTSVFSVFRQVEALNRDTKRLCNLALSPVLTNITELSACRQAGLLRPMGLQSFFLTRHNTYMEAYCRCWFTGQSLMTWGNFAFYSLSALMSAASAFAILLSNPSPEGAGLQIVYCFILPFCVNLMVLLYFIVSVTLTQLERIFEMKDVPHEAIQGSLGQLSAVSIADGSISFRGASLRYKPELPSALDNVNLEIPSGSRVGLCGRTGSGKSSMMVMLLRLVELDKGSIFLGGQSLKDMGLSALRRAVAMIPQEPFLMQGSVRRNLDPFGDRGDEEIASALQKVGLKCGLDDPVAGGGSNLSAGERQLLSFSRILLRDSKVVLLDEPTSSLDPMTDAKMGELVRSACCGRTVLTIAHRLKTILDSHLVVVLANGSIVESGSPEELLQRPDSQYSQMLQLAGEKTNVGFDANPGVSREFSI